MVSFIEKYISVIAYSHDPNTGKALIFYGGNVSGWQMVWYSEVNMAVLVT